MWVDAFSLLYGYFSRSIVINDCLGKAAHFQFPFEEIDKSDYHHLVEGPEAGRAFFPLLSKNQDKMRIKPSLGVHLCSHSIP
jgi:hypothetical protein